MLCDWKVTAIKQWFEFEKEPTLMNTDEIEIHFLETTYEKVIEIMNEKMNADIIAYSCPVLIRKRGKR